MMKYMQSTIGIPLILSIDKFDNLKWYIDALFAANMYMRRHTGSFITMETVGAYSQPSKHKLSTKSSTEANLVVVDDVLNLVIWN